MQPSTVLFLAANPVQVQPLQLGEECRAIENKIRAAKFRDHIRFRSRWAARPDDLLQALNEDTPRVLHFSGHGTGDQGLCFQSEDGNALSMTTDVLAQVMRAAGASVTVVVLNACYSEVQAQALVAHVPCVIGMSGTIGDEAAIIYAASFYRALAFGKSVANAHHQGIAALALHPTGRHARDIKPAEISPCGPPPRLLTRPDIDADFVHIVHEPTKRVVVVIKATLREFNADVLARVTEELRQLTGDLSLQITDVEEGSVRLTVSLSHAAARRLRKLRANGQLSQICGFDVSAIIRLRAATMKAQTMTDVAVRGQDERLIYALRGTGSGTEFAEGRGGESRESALWVALPRVTGKIPARTRAKAGSRSGPRTSTSRDEFARSRVPPGVSARADDPDRDIVSLVTTGDLTGALRSLMQRYGTAIYRYCRDVLRDSMLADDVQQQVFIEAYRDLTRFSGRWLLRTWLFAITYWRLRDAASRQRANMRIEAVPTADALDSSKDPDERIDDDRLREALFACIDQLGEYLRSALFLHFKEGFSYEEMAQICGETPATLQTRVTRVLPLLRACVTRRTGGEL